MDRNVIIHDKLDKLFFSKIEDAGLIQETTEKASGKTKLAEELVQDAFFSLYKYKPELASVVAEEALPHREAFSKAFELKEFKELRASTRLDVLASGVATATLVPRLLELLPDDLKEKQNELAEARDQHKQIGLQIVGLKELIQQASGQRKHQLQQQLMKLQSQSSQLQQKIQKLSKEVKDLTAKYSKQITLAMRKASKEAKEKAKDVSQLLSWGMEPGEPETLENLKEKMEVARKLMKDEKLQKIIKMAGRYRRLALSIKKQKIREAVSEVYTIKMNSDLKRALPSELVKVAVPELKPLFLMDLINGKILSYELKGKERVGRGPVIVLIDNSGSMSGYKEVWSKAVALGIFAACFDEGRKFIGVHFSSRHDPLIEVEILPRTNKIPQRIYRFISTFIGGGTDFEKPLNRAVELMGELPKADVILITDGICAVSDEWLKRFLNTKRELDFKVLSIVVGQPGACTDETLLKFSDVVYNPLDLEKEGDDVAVQIFNRIS